MRIIRVKIDTESKNHNKEIQNENQIHNMKIYKYKYVIQERILHCKYEVPVFFPIFFSL